MPFELIATPQFLKEAKGLSKNILLLKMIYTT